MEPKEREVPIVGTGGPAAKLLERPFVARNDRLFARFLLTVYK
jgi:hypothetical protein